MPPFAPWQAALAASITTVPAVFAGTVGVDYLTQAEALAVYFPTADRFERAVVIPPDGVTLRRGSAPAYFRRFEAYKGDTLLGFAVVDDVMGKARPITYMLATDLQGDVLGIEILAYRESHGHEVGRAAFRDQFKGRDVDDALRLGGDIRNISGATISCRSITDGVADLLTLLKAAPVAPTDSVPTDSEAAYDLEVELPCGATHSVCRSRVLMNAPLGIALRFAPDSDAKAPETNDPSATESAERIQARQAALARIERAFTEVARLEALLSAFAEDSDPARLAAAAGGEAIALAPETLELLHVALDVAKSTDGAVTPLAEPIARLYRQAQGEVHAAALHAAVQLSSVRWLEQTDGGRVALQRAGMGLNFGASGKGFALDAAARALQAKDETGAENGTNESEVSGALNFGGQLLVIGAGPALPVALADGTPLELESGSLATTSAAERGAHVFDARTGAPVAMHGAVTVWAATAVQADLWSSALYVLGEKPGLELAKRLGLAAHFAASDSAPAQVTPAWRERFAAH